MFDIFMEGKGDREIIRGSKDALTPKRGSGIFSEHEIKVFILKELVGKTLKIESYEEDGFEMIFGIDINTGVNYVLAQRCDNNAPAPDASPQSAV